MEDQIHGNDDRCELDSTTGLCSIGITRSFEKETCMLRQHPFVLRGSGSAFAALASFVTTLCCSGFPALVGFLSADGGQGS